MSRRSPEGSESDLLFDLPLDPSAADPPAGKTAEDESGVEGTIDQAALAFPPDDEPAAEAPVEAPVAARFTAGLLDLVALVAALGLVLLALRVLEIPIGGAMLAPLALFLASFSFLYQVMPLAFWGHTPGMAFASLHSRAKDGDFMTIQQCILRWIGWLLTLASGGLAALLALSGVSLSDLLSGTRSFVRPP